MKSTKIYNILVIEDNLGDYTIVDFLLRDYLTNPSIERADTFKIASAMLYAKETTFDVILLDLDLPDKKGENLLTDILKLSGNCPVIILTGLNNIDFSIDSITKGISDYLLKDELSSIILYKSIIYSIERKKNMIALAESEKKYSDLFQLSPQPMCLYETDTYKFMYVNQAAVNHYGYSNLEFLNMTLLDLLPPINIPYVLAHLQAQNRQLNQTYTGEFKTYKKSGELIDVQTFSTPLIISNQKTTLVIVLDVTEKNLYEQKITKAIIQAQENERYEIGAELHENVCQILFAGHMSLKMLKDSLQVKDLVWYEQSIEYMQAAIQEIRGLTHRLAPVFYEDSTLEESIKGLITNLDIENQFDFTLLLDEAFKNCPCKQEFQLALYRILQEQFRNIIKHAQATTIKVNGSINDDILIMSITDNGNGFDIKKVKSGIGLANMKRRIEVFMGKFILVSSLGNGCTVSLIVPLENIYKID